ncbi:hypothetical protein HZA33_01185 [Candidatus Pacearchaeota archaeon]|nr:hypothetical protein [Candidatus Pacearchaeota archaeon]
MVEEYEPDEFKEMIKAIKERYRKERERRDSLNRNIGIVIGTAGLALAGALFYYIIKDVGKEFKKEENKKGLETKVK